MVKLKIKNLKLIYLTNSYPFDSALDWKTNELRVFKDYFDEILVVIAKRGEIKVAERAAAA